MRLNTRPGLVNYNLKMADQLFRCLLPAVPAELMGLDLTMAQLKITLLLFISGPQRMSFIARQMGITLPTATTFVDRLVDKGYIVRESQSGDRRVVLCRLSDEGQKSLSRMWQSSRKQSRGLLEQLDMPKLRMLSEILAEMVNNARKNCAVDDEFKKAVTADL